MLHSINEAQGKCQISDKHPPFSAPPLLLQSKQRGCRRGGRSGSCGGFHAYTEAGKSTLLTAWTSCNVWPCSESSVKKVLMYYRCNRAFPSHQLPMSLEALIGIPHCTWFKGDRCADQYLLTLIKLQRTWKHACLLLLVHAAERLCHDCWRCWQEQSLYKEPLLSSQHRCNVLLLYSSRSSTKSINPLIYSLQWVR